LNEKSIIGVRLSQGVQELLVEDGGLDGVDGELLVVAVTDGDGQSNQSAAVIGGGPKIAKTIPCY
jgi:hypothetical protein